MAVPSSVDSDINRKKKKKNPHYILSLMDEKTLERAWHIRLTRSGVIVTASFSIILLLVLFSCIILFTPLRKLLPTNTEEFREELVEQAVKVDSLQHIIDVQSQYLSTFRNVLAGEISTDTVLSLDSFQIVSREQLLEARSQVTEDFMAEYEARDSMLNVNQGDSSDGFWVYDD